MATRSWAWCGRCIFAGASTLVLSYWEVDSAATALWMQAFYEAALTQPLAAAARTALVKVKNTPDLPSSVLLGSFWR